MMSARIYLCAIALGLFATGCAFFTGPDTRDPLPVTVKTDAETIARGEYLVNHVSLCAHCHSLRDWERFSVPVQKGTEGGGGDCFSDKEIEGFPGRVCGSNISPHADGIGEWTDGEVLRAIREGVNREGDTLFPMMPYKSFKDMSDRDAGAVVAYLRTLQPIAGKHPSDISFPVSRFINFAPQPLDGPVPEPDRTDSVKHGEYLVTIGGCRNCHTMHEKGEPVEGFDLAGGQEFKGEGMIDIRSANITPDKTTGIGGWTREAFIARFKAFEGIEAPKVEWNQNTLMPWIDYAGMTEEDLGAIYDYLQTVPPVTHKVDAWNVSVDESITTPTPPAAAPAATEEASPEIAPEAAPPATEGTEEKAP